MNQKILDHTLLDPERLARLQTYAELCTDLRGHFAEVGVYKGGSAFLLAETMANTGNPNRLLLFDTFCGMPETQPIDDHKLGDFSDTSVEAVQALLSPFNRVDFFKGVFPKVAPAAHDWFSLVHLDCDIYESVRDGLRVFTPKMVPGGFIVLDDVNAISCKGALQAAGEFCGKTGRTMVAPCGPSVVIRF